ncbi:MAG TPA: acyl-CoA desaturase [Fimbriiglobus sp.]|nr:acyl-CoA desaturase [Fimbriiglobus sp.]
MKTIRFRHETDSFYAELRSRVEAYFRAAGKGRYADRLFWIKLALFGSLAVGSYGLILWCPFPPWVLVPLVGVYGVAVVLLGINAGHDAAHRVVSRSAWVNEVIQFGCFTLVGVNGYLWRMRHTQSHHIFPNVNGCDIDIDENPFLRLSPNQPWRPHFRFQHLYAPLAYVFVALHTILYQDFAYLFKRRLANMTDIRHPWHQYLLFAVSKALYFGLTLALPMAVLPLPWWQVLLGYLGMTAAASVAFVFLLIGTHFAEGTEFPATDADGNLPRSWAEHNLATACDWSPTSFWAQFFVGGANAHAAHHLFPKVCHTHYRAIAGIVVEAAAEFGLPYHRTTLPAMIRSHFRFLRAMGRKPGAIHHQAPAVCRVSAPGRGQGAGIPGPPTLNSPSSPLCRPASLRSSAWES